MDYANAYLRLKEFFTHQTLGDVLFRSKDFRPGTSDEEEAYLYHEGILSPVIYDYLSSETPSELIEALQALHFVEVDASLTVYDIVELFEREYFARSMDKPLSPYFADVLASDGVADYMTGRYTPYESVTWGDPEKYFKLFKDIDRRYGHNALCIVNALLQEYNPLNNYDMSQTETPNITHAKYGNNTETETLNLTNTKLGSSNMSDTPTLLETRHEERNTDMSTAGDNSASTWGFNTAVSVATPISEGDAHSRTQGSKTDNYTDGTIGLSGKRSDVVEQHADTETQTGTRTTADNYADTETETGTRSLTRSGNSGVITSQQMLQSELELRKYDVMETIYEFFDKILVRSVYVD